MANIVVEINLSCLLQQWNEIRFKYKNQLLLFVMKILRTFSKNFVKLLKKTAAKRLFVFWKWIFNNGIG